MVLRVDDTNAQFVLSQLFETMTDVDTGTGPAPLTNVLYTAKSASADATVRKWRLFADSRVFYLFTDSNAAWSGGLSFGDIIEYKPGDAYACFVCGGQSNNWGNYLTFLDGNQDNFWFPRSYSGTGGPLLGCRWSHKRNTVVGYAGMSAVPNPVDNKLHAWPIDVWENNAWARGLMPGIFSPLHNGYLGDGRIMANEEHQRENLFPPELL